ncbi:MAG: hypothetical protein NZ578_05265 [Candidatus Binatia bacterium]|nr:hypothetical protein [Candidatus Binatia bacterium]
MTHHPPHLVYASRAGNLFTLQPTTGQVRQLTWSWDDGDQDSAAPDAAKRSVHKWPTWAPDGSRIAYFGLREGGASPLETSLYVVTADGVESWELVTLRNGIPIYGNWSPRGDLFALLVQRGDRHLSLEIAHLARPGTTTTLLTGAPLFWSWSPQGDLLAVHVGGSWQATETARVLVLEAHSGHIAREISSRPGDFRVPAWSPTDDLLAYAEANEENGNTLFLYDVGTGDKGPVTTTNGSLAAIWSPDGRLLAVGCTAHSGSSVMSVVKSVDLARGQISPLLTHKSTAFFWAPTGNELFYVDVDEGGRYLRWHRLSRTSGENTELARFLPSREQIFLFSFFDQYVISHPPLAPDGSALAFAGFLAGTGSPLRTTLTPHIYLVPLDRSAPTRAVATGDFACWPVK